MAHTQLKTGSQEERAVVNEIAEALDDLEALAVSNAVGDGTITAAKLASDAVTTIKILNANVTTAKLATAAVTGAKVDAGALKMFTITGADASGGAAQATCTGAKVGDTVVGVSNLTDLSSASAVCETTITVVDKLVINSTNLSAKKLLVFLIQRS